MSQEVNDTLAKLHIEIQELAELSFVLAFYLFIYNVFIQTEMQCSCPEEIPDEISLSLTSYSRVPLTSLEPPSELKSYFMSSRNS